MPGMSEDELRDRIWAERANWSSLVEDLPFEVDDHGDVRHRDVDVARMGPEGLMLRLLRTRVAKAHHLVQGTTLLAKEVQVEQEGRGRMYMDLFGVPFELGAPGLCVIELKVSPGAARQSFTELLGYGNGLRLHFPGLSRDDLVHVLVAPMSSAPRIVRNSVASFLAFDRRLILVLEPRVSSRGALSLWPWLPGFETLGLLSRAVFSFSNFDLVYRAWEEDEGWWPREELMGIAAYAALQMEAAGIHGFAYCSKHQAAQDLATPNWLVCVGLNPYRVATRLMMAVGSDNASEQREESSLADGVVVEKEAHEGFVSTFGLRIGDFVPALSEVPADVGYADDVDNLQSVWSAHLSEIAESVARRSTRRTDGAHVSIEHGVMDFDQWVNNLHNDVFVERTPVRPTGRVRELYEQSVELDYEFMTDNEWHPLHGDMFRYAGETLGAHYFFREFLQRMVRAGGSVGSVLAAEQGFHEED